MALITTIIHSLLLFITISVLLFRVSAKDSAWNGFTTPGSAIPALFTPYYVPPGAKSYDSASPMLKYSGRWMDSFGKAYVQHSMRWSSEPLASMSFSFIGTGIEWFGNIGNTYGLADVYIDGAIQYVNSTSDVSQTQQRIFWKFDLPYGKHTCKIVNSGKNARTANMISIEALVVTKGTDPKDLVLAQPSLVSPHTGTSPSSAGMVLAESIPSQKWTLEQKGSTGVHAMQLAIISTTHALVIDKVEHNPLTISGHPAWAALYNLNTHSVTPIAMQSNSFCAGGTFLGNGTMVNIGGNPIVDGYTSAADFGDVDGLQAIRLFHPCDSSSADDCNMYENHGRIRMASPRWYNTVIRISDGSAMIIGGAKKGGWINNSTVNNPTVEYFPPKSIQGSNGMPIELPFLVDTLNSNLFPIAIHLPDGTVFMAANNDAMIYDWKNNKERRLPKIPNGVRVTYPMTGTGLLLPLSPINNYEPEVLLCGGSTIDDQIPGYSISSQDPASAQCSRMVLTDEGISAGWQVEDMPEARTMPDIVLLPTGDVFIVNGAGSGMSGYGNVHDPIGASNADNPVLAPVLYKPLAPAGQRFTSDGMPTSAIPRLYHSVATLTPEGNIMVAGSNPNLDRSEMKYGTEYRVEWFGPPYMALARPSIEGEALEQLDYGHEVRIKVNFGVPVTDVKVLLMDLGYVTHAFHANSRLVYLESLLDGNILTITGPPNGNIYPPGPAFMYIVADGVPSKGMKVMVGDGKGPVVDEGALQNVLDNSTVDQYEKSRNRKDDGSE